jgi:hypothetical protein
MYYNVKLFAIPYYSLIDLIDQKASKELKEKLEEKFKGNDEEKAKFFHQCLYESTNKMETEK